MKIRMLTIENFRNYVGPNTFNLETGGDRNIILIGGQNGAGKTSLADSIRLCLYGNKANGEVMSEAKYQAYLDNVCSKSSRNGSFSITLDLIMDEENPPIEVRVTRTFKRNKGKFSEELTLRKGDSEIELIDEDYWSYYIEKLIPPTVSRYFFFDGERVRDTIASDGSREYLQNAVNDISGITSLKNLKTDLIEVRKRIVSKTTQKSNLDHLDELRGELSELSNKSRRISEDIEDQNLFRSDYVSRRTDLEEERSRLIGSSESKRAELNDTLKEMGQSLDGYNQSVIDFCHSRLMYKLAAGALNRTIAQAKSENSSLINRFSIETLENLRDNGDVGTITGLDEDSAKRVLDSIIASISASDDGSPALLDLTLSRIEQMEGLRVTDAECLDFIESFEDREFYNEEMEKLKRMESKITDESLDGINDSIMECSTEIGVLERQIGIMEAEKQTLESRMNTINTEIARLERTTILQDVDRASVETINQVIETIDKRVELILFGSREKLTKKVNEMYHMLKNTKDMVKEIVITDALELELRDFSDKPINTEFISEGEKGILMYSVVYGLHSLSSMSFPVIIDSPLGRMDNLHVNNLAGKLFPTIADQVLLLSHDREVIGENHRLIGNSVQKEYLITKYGNPKVTEGYFE